MCRTKVFGAKYPEFTCMSSIISHREAERISDHLTLNPESWHIPHHGVLNPNKQDKLRVVQNCSKSDGRRPLNGCLLSEVSLRTNGYHLWHRAYVPPVRSSQTRSWLSEGIQDYRMAVHQFRDSLSHNCAKYGNPSAQVQQFILNYFYVDDGQVTVKTKS